ncbi:MAG: spore germination protein GerW family protein [Calditrichota bacterium]
MSHNPEDILNTLLARLREMANTETIVGEPVTVGDVVILPVIKFSVGFAAGGGEGSIEQTKSGKGAGGGGGGGASVSPVGFIVYDGEKVQFLNVAGKGKIETLIETVPDLLKKFGITKKGHGKEHGKEHPADDSE